MYPIKSFTLTNKTYNKVSMQHYIMGTLPPSPLKLSPPPLVACIAIPNLVTFKHPPHIFAPPNPKSHNYDKYIKVPHIVSSYHQCHKANLKVLFTCSSTSPTQHQQIHFKVYLFSKSLTYN